MNLYEVVLSNIYANYTYIVLAENEVNALKTIKDNKDKLISPFPYTIDDEDVTLIMNIYGYEVPEYRYVEYVETNTGIILLEYYEET